METKLAPCPFCGGEVILDYYGSGNWHFNCVVCPTTISIFTGINEEEPEESKAIEIWNKRVK